MTFTVIEGGKKAATVEQLAAIQFGAVGRIARMPKAKRLKNLDDIATSVREFSLVASEIIVHDKAKLVRRPKLRPFRAVAYGIGPCGRRRGSSLERSSVR